MKHFKAGLLWEQNRQKPLKLQENSLFGPFLQNTRTKTQATKNKNTKKQKKHTKKTPFCILANHPLFL